MTNQSEQDDEQRYAMFHTPSQWRRAVPRKEKVLDRRVVSIQTYTLISRNIQMSIRVKAALHDNAEGAAQDMQMRGRMSGIGYNST